MKKLTPLKAIRANCLACSAGVRYEVIHCPMTDCPLYYYRQGRSKSYPRQAQSVELRESSISTK